MKKLIIALVLALVVIAIANMLIVEYRWFSKADMSIEHPTVNITYTLYPSKTSYREISYYSELDSCHYPTAKGCLTASGKIAEVGMVASNLFPFGTKLVIDGLTYTVEDRTNDEYSYRIDIFTGYGQRAYEQAKQLGITNKLVKIQ